MKLPQIKTCNLKHMHKDSTYYFVKLNFLSEGTFSILKNN